MSNAEVFLSKEDFIKQAKSLSGSRDFGAQLFCALLRSVAVEARIVCSLQPLPFSGTIKDMNPKSFAGAISTDGNGTSANELSNTASISATSRPNTRRINQPQFSRSQSTRTSRASGELPSQNYMIKITKLTFKTLPRLLENLRTLYSGLKLSTRQFRNG